MQAHAMLLMYRSHTPYWKPRQIRIDWTDYCFCKIIPKHFPKVDCKILAHADVSDQRDGLTASKLFVRTPPEASQILLCLVRRKSSGKPRRTTENLCQSGH